VVRSRAEVPLNVPETVATNRSVMDHAVGSSQAHQPQPQIATTVVSRGDSLWRISRINYGEGMRYAVVYKANQDQIRNPNRIYPGQIFVLPMKAR
jgi:nucleoid-associated protein YgaU